VEHARGVDVVDEDVGVARTLAVKGLDSDYFSEE
jgi:hypothetical protein